LVKLDQEWGEGTYYPAVAEGSQLLLPLQLLKLELTDEVWGLLSDVELFQPVG
jgi:hypothetical protein